MDTPTSGTSPVHFNLNFLPWRKESATRQTVEAAVSRGNPAPAPEKVVRGSSAYLPTGGSIPLRFSSARTWPERMAPAHEAALAVALAPDPDLAIRRDELLAEHAAGIQATPSVVPPDTGTVTTTAASSQADEYREPQVLHRPLLYGLGEAVLTTDLILRSLDDISNDRGAVPGQFRPAVPESRPVDSVPPAAVR